MTQDAAPEPSAAVLTSTCTLHLGDCLDVISTLVPSSVAMIFADLPYQSTRQHWDQAIDIAMLWEKLETALDRKKLSILTATHPFAVDVIAANRKHFRYDLIWQKSIATGHLNAKRMPLRSHESVLVFYKSLPAYNPQTTKGKPYCFMHDNTNTSYGKQKTVKRENEGYRYPQSVIKINHGNRSSLHPTQKPVALLEWLIKTYTNPGDTVLDPTFGSCTTGVACARLGRNFIGIEKDAGYFRAGRERVDAERAKLGLPPCEAKQ